MEPRICPACGIEPAAAGDRYCEGCGSAPDRTAWLDGPLLQQLRQERDPGYRAELHLAVTLTGGHVPAHVEGAYPRLACCGGPIELVRPEADPELVRPAADPELVKRAQWGDR